MSRRAALRPRAARPGGRPGPAAGDSTLPYFRSAELDVEHKDDDTPVTAADRGAERLLREELGGPFPDDAIVGEEEADQAGTSGRTWIIDPIDGTKAFTHGVPLYCTLLAADRRARPAARRHQPARRCPRRCGPAAASGCFLDGEPLPRQRPRHASTAPTSPPARCGTGPRARSTPPTPPAPYVRTWGDAYGYALVATGRVEAMVDHEAAVWDVAPMPVIIGEAGGRFTDLQRRRHPRRRQRHRHQRPPPRRAAGAPRPGG